MPLVLDPDSLPREQLTAMLRASGTELAELLAMTDAPPAAVREPLGVLTAGDLLRAAIRVGEAVDRPATDAATLAAALNLQYEAMLAAIDLVKMHTAMAKVPRGH
jgi:hypothetical protein